MPTWYNSNMTTDLITTPEYLPISPEMLEIANTYIETMDINLTAQHLGLPIHKVAEYIGKAEVQNYITEIFLNSGYRNRFKIGTVLDKIIDAKLLELEEAGITSSKDILDIIAMQHKMRMDELNAMIEFEKARNQKPKKQTNIQINHTKEKRSIFETLVDNLDDIGN